MPRRQRDDDYLDDDEYPEFDGGDEDSVDTVPCPYCKQAVYEDVERCPSCENYLSQEDSPPQTRPWMIVAALLALAGALTWVFCL